MSKLVPSILLLIFCSCSSAKRDQSQAERPLSDTPKRVASVYRISAFVIPESLLVRAEIEIDVQNIYSDSFDLFWFAAAPENRRREGGQSCRINQLEVNGAPVKSDGFSEDSSTALVKLPLPLAPGQRVAVSFSLDAKMTDNDRWDYSNATGILFRNWLPRVILGSDQVRRPISFVDLPSDFEISVSIDSGWFVVAPGELLNDKSLLGMMPSFDTVMVDVMHNPYVADGYVFSRLPSEQGRDTYVMRRRYNRGYDFLVLRGYILDRGRRGDETVNAYYPQELASKWKYRLIDIGFGLNRSDQTQGLGASSESTKIVAVGKKSKWYSSGIRLIGAR